MKLYELNSNQTRCITAENPSGEKNNGARATNGTGFEAAEKLGPSWKISPSIIIKPLQNYTIADINGMGIIKSMWMTHSLDSRLIIIKIYWEGEVFPSVKCPLGDFYFNATGKYFQINSRFINVNPTKGFNSFWEMPFNKKCRIEIENLNEEEIMLYYQINFEYCIHENPISYFHSFYKRESTLVEKGLYTIMPKICSRGCIVSTYLFWQLNSNLWWGEGEFKCYIDDDEFPTICGTGTEDYFGGAWNFENPYTKKYQEYSSNYFGFYQEKEDETYLCNKRINMYRIHENDYINFSKNIIVEIQALGWKPGFKNYHKLNDDISSVINMYLEKPQDCRINKMEKEELEIV